MHYNYDNAAEPPGVFGTIIHQDHHTGLFHLECNLTPNCFQLVTNTIINEMGHQSRTHADSDSSLVFTPTTIVTKMDETTGHLSFSCDLDLHYLRLIIDALENEQGIDSDDEFDVFISYAHSDEEYVKQLVKELRSLGIKVWHDRSHIHWGDNHRDKMDYGIRHSKYSIVVCSPHYFSEYKFWPKTELNAAYQAESIRDHQILPIWHHVTEEQVYNYSPMLASKDHMDSSIDMPLEIAVALLALLHPVNFENR